MTVRVNPTPVEQVDKVPEGIPLTAFGAALTVMFLGWARSTHAIPVPDGVFYVAMTALSVGWFCFAAAAAILKRQRIRLFQAFYRPLQLLFIAGAGLILFGFMGFPR